MAVQSPVVSSSLCNSGMRVAVAFQYHQGRRHAGNVLCHLPSLVHFSFPGCLRLPGAFSSSKIEAHKFALQTLPISLPCSYSGLAMFLLIAQKFAMFLLGV